MFQHNSNWESACQSPADTSRPRQSRWASWQWKLAGLFDIISNKNYVRYYFLWGTGAMYESNELKVKSENI